MSQYHKDTHTSDTNDCKMGLINSSTYSINVSLMFTVKMVKMVIFASQQGETHN